MQHARKPEGAACEFGLCGTSKPCHAPDMKATFLRGLMLVAVCFDLATACAHSGVVFPVVTASGAGSNLVSNGDFGAVREGRAISWTPAPQGNMVVEGEGRGGSRALRCDSPTGKGWFGANQTLTLNRTRVRPLRVQGWSRAEGVEGGPDSNYSLYADLVYQDGSTLWGQVAQFSAGTHDWARREVLILPDQPVRSLTLHCLFRGRQGKVWFDDVSLEELGSDEHAVLFQGAAVQTMPAGGRLRNGPSKSVASEDGFALRLVDQSPMEVQASGRPLVAGNVGGFLCRDVAAGSGFMDFRDGKCEELGLSLKAEFVPQANHILVRGRITSLRLADRAITLVFALPMGTNIWTWGDDLRASRPAKGNTELGRQVAVRCGATGTMSLYPVGAIWSQAGGMALGLDMGHPAVYRLGCHPGLGILYLAYDFALTRETEKWPNAAEFQFTLYRFDPAWGFRAAWQKYMEVFPDHFTVRTREQGLWMPFTDVSKVQGWQDFGFKFHEGNNNVLWDDEHGIQSFRYTEPMTWWMPMDRDMPRTMANALRVRDQAVSGGNDKLHRMAMVSREAAMFDEQGNPTLLFRDEPWCRGAVWSLNPNPWLGRASWDAPARSVIHAATTHWSEDIKERLYGSQARGRLDGEYLDSLEGYVTAELSFRRDHFRRTTVPLTFSRESCQPALFKGLAVQEFTRWMSEDVHRLGKLMFANGVPYRFGFLCPWLDVLGTETDWMQGGRYRPASTSQMTMWRALSGAKPYLLLMNTDYDKFTPEYVELYFQRALFLGLWPGFFSHNAADNPYWQNPAWYNRDRPLFKKYIPVIKQVAEAGWQPVTLAVSDNPEILLERFGPSGGGGVYLTAYNDSTSTQQGVVRWSPQIFPATKPRELTRGGGVGVEARSARVALEPGQVAVFAW
jgi:hypothetical protein